MRTIQKNLWACALVLPFAFFVACTSDSDVQVLTPDGKVYDEDEYASLAEDGIVDVQGNIIDEGSPEARKMSSNAAKAESAASEKKSSSSTDKATSSNSEKAESSADKATSSSSEKAESSADKATSSSSEKAESSADKVTSSNSEKTESSADKVESSSSEPESSSAEPGKQTVANTAEGDFSFGTDDMKEVSESAQSELDSLKQILDEGGTVEGFEKTDMEFNEETLPVEVFDEMDIFCFTGEGEWLQITKEMLGEYIPHYKNDHAWGNLRHFDIKFMDACEAVYIRHK